MSTHENRDIHTILAQLRAQVDTYVPGETKIIPLEDVKSERYFYDQSEINQSVHQDPTKKQELHTLVSNMLSNNSKSSTSGKHHCYHMFCKAIMMFRNSKYPDLSLPSTILKLIWKRVEEDGYKPQFQKAAKLFNSGSRLDIYPTNIDYSIYLREYIKHK